MVIYNGNKKIRVMWCNAINVDNRELECMINANGPKMSMATRYSCMINARKQCEQWTLNIKQQSKQEESTL
jgi:hypothetical protein